MYIDENTGAVLRKWVYDHTMQCKVEPIKVAGSSTRTDNKKFMPTKEGDYTEKFQLKIKCNLLLSKRWRIQNIRSSDNKPVYVEIDRLDQPDTIFEVVQSHAVLDPFGKISYYEVTLQRVHVQNDNTSAI